MADSIFYSSNFYIFYLFLTFVRYGIYRIFLLLERCFYYSKESGSEIAVYVGSGLG